MKKFLVEVDVTNTYVVEVMAKNAASALNKIDTMPKDGIIGEKVATEVTSVKLATMVGE